ncbi:hypothetical protein [Aeromonas caviae]|uniref:hypothetical protein n=1 Tax=Aeromonas caviae TaxID=648 RepID=UPI000AF5B7F3|nr:hypothetical protein [Aeromonas caviae]
MLTWITEIKHVVNSLDGKRFCALVDHRQHQGVVLSALPHLQETYQWLTQKNLVAIASLYSARCSITSPSPASLSPIRTISGHSTTPKRPSPGWMRNIGLSDQPGLC